MIGGTGLQSMAGVETLGRHQLQTTYSETRISVTELGYQGQNFYFLGRHGDHQQIPPHLINYRANLDALSQLGIQAILAVTAVGGVGEGLAVGDLLVPDQLIDYTWGRESTFFDGGPEVGGRGGRRHIDFTYPYSQRLRTMMLEQGANLSRKVHAGGTYACTQGPRLETAAEIRKLKAEGADIVGMTSMPEAILARELGIDYASVSVVVNPAAGLVDEELSEEDILRECERASEDISLLLLAVISALHATQ